MADLLCCECGEKFSEPSGSGRWPLYCSLSCRQGAPPVRAKSKEHPPWTPKEPDTPCSGCGEVMWSTKSGASDPKCRDCRQKARLRRCAHCGDAFLAERASREAKFCSRDCFSAARKGAPRDPLTYKNARPCADCGAGVLGSPNPPRCVPCLRARQASPSAKAHLTELYRDKCRRRRALKRGAVSERYTTTEIAERDGFVCQLCSEPVVMSTPYPDPWSPSIDHRIPLARGGDDTKANVQLAHRICNIRKSDRMPEAG